MGQQRRNTIKLNKFANFRNTYFQIPTIQIYTSLQQPRHYFFSTQALLDDVCIFLKNSPPLKPLLLSITLLLPAIMLLLPVCAKILSKYLAALPLPQASSKSTTLQQLMSIFQQFSASPHFNIQSSNPILLVQD